MVTKQSLNKVLLDSFTTAEGKLMWDVINQIFFSKTAVALLVL